MTHKLPLVLLFSLAAAPAVAKNLVLQVWEHKPLAELRTPNWEQEHVVVSPKGDQKRGDIGNALTGLKNRIARGDVKPGESVVVVIHAHPSAKEPEHNFIYNIDYSILAQKNAETTAQSLRELMVLTERAGVKLGVVDLDYYSDATRALAAEAPANTCLITAKVDRPSADKPQLPVAFRKNFGAPGASLEDAFLRSFPAGLETERAFINSPAHAAAVAQVEAIRGDGIALKLTPHTTRSRLTAIAEQGCEQKINLGFEELIADIQKIQGHDPALKAAREKYLAALERYRATQLAAFKDFVDIGGIRSTGARTFASETLDPATGEPLVSLKLSLRSFYNNETGLLAAALGQGKYRHKDDPKFPLYEKAYAEVAQQIRELQKSVSDKVRAYEKREAQLLKQYAKRLTQQHDEVFARSKDFYLAHYRSSTGPKPSACQAIKVE